MTSVKISYGSEIRRVTLANEEARGLSSYASFIAFLKELFPQLSDSTISLFWNDDDGDKITVSSDLEFKEAVRFMSGQKSLRFEVAPTSQSSKPAIRTFGEVVPIHRGIICDECGMNPIRGIRYKCTVRNDFDLCETCEAKKRQPYPMVKITDPDHHPSALFYAFQEQEDRTRGNCPWRRGGCRRWQQQQQQQQPGNPAEATGSQASPAKPEADDVPKWKARWDRRGERCGRKLRETVAPFVAAFDKLVSDPVGVSDELASAIDGAVESFAAKFGVSGQEPQKSPEEQLEEQLMQEALQESILLNEVATAFSSVSTAPSESTASAAAVPAPAPSGNIQLSKPALRFIKDVTFPDGTVVQPGATFRKVWKVRNDGTYPWPEGVVLVTAGGDLMCDEKQKFSLPLVGAGDEVEIAVDLRAPQAAGLYCAYFRAQTADGSNFGHRLWATVMVTEPEEEWTPVSKPMGVESPVVSPTQSNVVPAAAVLKELEVIPPTAVVSATALAVESQGAPASLQASNVSLQSSTSSNVQPLHLLWRKELQALADMGFVDYDANLPLLQQHLVTPVSLSGDRNATPSVEGMQRIVAALLGM